MTLHTTTAAETLPVLLGSFLATLVFLLLGYVALVLLTGRNPSPSKTQRKASYYVGACTLYLIPTLYFYFNVSGTSLWGWNMLPQEWYLLWLLLSAQNVWYLCWLFFLSTPRSTPS